MAIPKDLKEEGLAEVRSRPTCMSVGVFGGQAEYFERWLTRCHRRLARTTHDQRPRTACRRS